MWMLWWVLRSGRPKPALKLRLVWLSKDHASGDALPYVPAQNGMILLALQSRKLEYKQQQLEHDISDLQEAFDSALAVLRREKLKLEADVKAAQIKRLIYQQELQLLKV